MTRATLEHERYSSIAILLHWLLALGLAFQLALGFAMPKDETGFAAYQLHKSVGIAILLLTLLRLAWRLAKRPPPPVEQGLTALAAKAVHAGFYAVLILGPLTGWLLVSTASIQVPTVLFGIVPWPHLPVSPDIHSASEAAHELLSWLAIGLFVLHVAGALRHHFILRHRLIERMAPAGSVKLAGLLSALVLAIGLTTFVVAGREAPSEDLPSVPDRPAPATTAAEDQVANTELEQAALAEPAEAAEPAAEPTAPEPAPAWAVQPGGRLSFAVRNGEDTIQGSFGRWSGTIRLDPDNPDDADIRIEVDLASASVGDATMDSMLKGEDFLAVGTQAKAVWRSTSVRRVGDGRYRARGTLALRGLERPQELAFSLTGSGSRRRAEGNATIDRRSLGVGQGPSAETLAPSVLVEFAFDAVRQ